MTSDERREVAATLRDAKRKCDGRGYPWMTDDLILAIGYEHDYEADNGIFDRLADLIDPTCHLWPSHDGGFGCDRCFTWFPEMKAKTRYCPACGARVVDDE